MGHSSIVSYDMTVRHSCICGIPQLYSHMTYVAYLAYAAFLNCIHIWHIWHMWHMRHSYFGIPQLYSHMTYFGIPQLYSRMTYVAYLAFLNCIHIWHVWIQLRDAAYAGMPHSHVIWYNWGMPHIQSHIQHLIRPGSTTRGIWCVCVWVMSHTWMSHVSHMCESCHSYEWVCRRKTWLHEP